MAFIDSMTEQELATSFDFSGDEKKKEAHWQRDKNLRDVLEVRRALEELAGELACKRMTEEEFKQLEKANHRFVCMWLLTSGL